ncbi:hypothetical protein ACN47E_002429 [Coniothyrium glycines]
MPYSHVFAILVLLWSPFVVTQDSRAVQSCTCGFLDSQTNQLFTDSIIVYFNETTPELLTQFVVEEYAEKSRKNWNTIYREGGDASNLRFNNSQSLELLVQPPTKEHLVMGASLRTVRRDIQHGSFRALIKSPGRRAQGSAMSMMWKYNETETTELSVMNTNTESEAWVGTFVNNEFPTRQLGMNYTQLINQTASNRNYTTLGGGLANGSVDAWDFTEYRIDWTADFISFYIGGNLTRQVLHKDNKGMPSVPSAFFFKHWASGNTYSMQGPPVWPSGANIGWIRMFFNSSSTTEEKLEDFAERCSLAAACPMDDIALRGSTEYVQDVATQRWKQDPHNRSKRMPALWVSVACLAFSGLLLIHTFIRRVGPKVNKDLRSTKSAPSGTASDVDGNEKIAYGMSAGLLASSRNSRRESINSSINHDAEDKDMAIERLEPSSYTLNLGGSTPKHGLSARSSTLFDSRAATPFNSHFNTTRDDLQPALPGHDSQLTLARTSHPARHLHVPSLPIPASQYRSMDKIAMETVAASPMPAPRLHIQPPRNRVDYLAGLTALCSLLVTVMHFGLTFVPAMVSPGAPQHSRSEYWAQKIVSPFLLNQSWLGVFFTTSVRFLVAPYLRSGSIPSIAKATVRRTPRLMLPVATVALLEYFCIDIGATKYLEYTPSLSWSTWPYVTRYTNFGQYISEVLELMFLIPNAVPQITFHYCTGVLWTIAVQLQGTWLVLVGAIVVREIKSPWKRMPFYLFCIVNHWYGLSWGSYFWIGLLLTDLDVTCAWKTYLYKRPVVYYAVITVCWLCVAAGLAASIAPNWTEGDFNFTASERNLHPDEYTGERLGNTQRAGYPTYYTPRLAGLLFAGGMQAVIELSGVVQWFFSTPPFLLMFPHVFTIYLLHGLVFWTWGSWLLYFLAERGFSYGINVAVVGVTSYALLFFSLPIVTPILEALGRDVTALIWMTAQEKSPPRRRTLFPFPDNLFTSREVNGKDQSADVESGSRRSSLTPEVGKAHDKDVEAGLHAPRHV